jgi:hypothetical protein
VKLHAINNEEPTKKFMGRKRKTAKEEGKKHHPITARGLGDALIAGEDDRCFSGEEPLLFGFVQIGFLNSEGTHMVAAFPLFFFVIFLCTTFFVGIRRRCAWGLQGS